MTQKKTNFGMHTAVLVAIIVTMVWGIFVYYFLGNGAACVWNSSGKNWWASHIECLEANEIGDVFAGTVAPLAFLWFVATAFMQSTELRDNREVMKSQASAMAIQNEIARRVAQANYRLARFEKVSDVFGKIAQVLLEPTHPNAFATISSTRLQAERLCPANIISWMQSIEDDVKALRNMLAEKERLDSRQQFGPREKDRLSILEDAIPKVESRLQDELREKKLETLFAPLLVLPSTLDLPA